MVNKAINKEEGNRKEVLEVLRQYDRGLTITGLARISNLTRDQVRTSVSYLLGSKEIEEEKVGTAKVYYLVNGSKEK